MVKKLSRYIGLLIFAAAICIAALLPFSQGIMKAQALSDEFYFESASVEITVNADKTYRVTETLQVAFNYTNVNTGIFRDIQRISQTTRIVNGKEKKGKQFFTQISDVEVTIDGEPARCDVYPIESGTYHCVEMYRPDESYFGRYEDEGAHEFKLSYTYDMSDDKVWGYDDFVFDIWGYEMAKCEDFYASVTFLEGTNLTEDMLSLRTRPKNRGWQTWSPVEESGEFCTITGNTVSLHKVGLSKNNGFTMQVILPNGYFSEAGEPTFFATYLIPILALLAGVGGLIALVLINRTQKPVESVEFYPPEGMSLARFSAVWHGKAKRKDLAGYLLKWSGKGYIALRRDGKSNFIALKLMDIPEEVEQEERDLFNAMFPGASMETVFRTSAKPLAAVAQAADALEEKANKPEPLVKGKKKYCVLVALCALLPIFGVFLYNSIINSSFLPIFFFIFVAAGTGVGAFLFSGDSGMPMNIIFFPIFFMAAPLMGFIMGFYLPLYDYAGLLWISLVWWAVTFAFYRLYGKRTEETLADLGKMRGFRNFILTAEKDRIEFFLDSNPEYFYDILPYCLVMGVSAKVQERYKALGMSLPEWSNWNMGTFSRACARSYGHISSSSGHHGSHGGGGGRHGSRGGGGGGGRSRGRH